MNLTDQDLRAYLSGQAEQSVTTAIEHALEHDDALAARLAALDPMAEPVRAAFANVPGDRPMPQVPGMDVSPDPQSGTWRLVAGLAIGAFLGVAGLLAVQDRPAAPEWQVAVAQYQALYGPETIAPLSAGPAELAGQFDRASQALGRRIDPDRLAQAVPDLTLKRAQLLHHGGHALVQIVFADDAGRPIAFCLLGDGDLPDQDWQSVELAGLHSVARHDDGFGVMLVGDRAPEVIAAWAETLNAQL